jgi:hypothetical protein
MNRAQTGVEQRVPLGGLDVATDAVQTVEPRLWPVNPLVFLDNQLAEFRKASHAAPRWHGDNQRLADGPLDHIDQRHHWKHPKLLDQDKNLRRRAPLGGIAYLVNDGVHRLGRCGGVVINHRVICWVVLNSSPAPLGVGEYLERRRHEVAIVITVVVEYGYRKLASTSDHREVVVGVGRPVVDVDDVDEDRCTVTDQRQPQRANGVSPAIPTTVMGNRGKRNGSPALAGQQTIDRPFPVTARP